MAQKVMQVGFYWPTLFKDAHDYVWKSSICQKHAGREARSSTPLQPIAIEEPFQQWVLDIIGEITPHSSKKHRYMHAATNYFTRWVEAIPFQKVNNDEVISPIKQHIISSNALWAGWVTPKTSINTSPYFLVCRKEAILPPNLYLRALRLAQESEGTPFPYIQSWIDILLKLEEERFKTKEKFAIHQAWIKRWFDGKSVGSHKFEIGDLVLKWGWAHEDKGKHAKFQVLWIGPFQFVEKIGHHTFKLQTLGGQVETLPVNGHDLKCYFT
eukprot:PITA_25193